MPNLTPQRLFFHRPSLALLDESTSSVSPDAESALMSLCARLGITLVSAAHRESMLRHHHRTLRLSGEEEGGWRLEEIVQGRPDPP